MSELLLFLDRVCVVSVTVVRSVIDMCGWVKGSRKIRVFTERLQPALLAFFGS